MQRPVYEYFDWMKFLLANMLRIGSLVFGVMWWRQIPENPPVLIGVMLILLAFLLFMGNVHLRLYPDRIEIYDYSFWNLLRGKRRTILLQGVRRAVAEHSFRASAVIVRLELRNGETQFVTLVSLFGAETIVRRINEQLGYRGA